MFPISQENLVWSISKGKSVCVLRFHKESVQHSDCTAVRHSGRLFSIHAQRVIQSLHSEQVSCSRCH